MGKFSFPDSADFSTDDDRCDFADALESNTRDFEWSPDDKYVVFAKTLGISFIDCKSNAEDSQRSISSRGLPMFLDNAVASDYPLLHPTISPDGQFLACSVGRTLYVFEVQSRKLTGSFRIIIEPESISEKDLEFRILEKTKYASGGEIDRLQEVEEMEFHQAINKLTWSPDSKHIFIDSSIGWMIFNISLQKPVKSNYMGRWQFCSSAVASDFRHVATVTQGIGEPSQFHIYNLSNSDLDFRYDLTGIVTSRLVWCPCARKFVFATLNGQLVVFDISQKVETVLCLYQDNYNPHLDWSRDGRLIAIHSPTMGVVVIDAQKGNAISNYKEKTLSPFSRVERGQFAWANTKNTLVIGRDGMNIDFWDVETQ
ncbi:MAG: hypothetical protein JSS83_25970 [Cyanobacteria bacterium SZAS LIN-3]|nr:hypothetical protein [Cyanobacteria bacterium SZAS LIN-3]